MQAMTRGDKRRGGAEWEWEEEADEGDEDGEAEGDHVPALPERGGATRPNPHPTPNHVPALPERGDDHAPRTIPPWGGVRAGLPAPGPPVPAHPPAPTRCPTRPLRRELQAGALLVRLVQVQPRLRTRAERLGHGPRDRLSARTGMHV